jgi:hypothetical protein
MSTITTAGRGLSIAAGLAFTGGALTILLHDVVVLGHPWTMAHTLAVLTVAGVILAGELAREAWGSHHYGACLGFWLAVVVGTGLVVYNSVGRQAEASDTSTLSVEDRNDQRSAAKADLAAHQKMLDEELAAHAEEAKHGGCKAACKGIEASITVYEAAVAGDRAKLDKLGAPEPVAPKAEKFAEILGLFGADKAQAKAVLSLLEPFLYTLLFEYGSIVAWGYAFRRRSAELKAERSPNRGGGRKVRRYTKQEAAADLVTRLALGERFGSQNELKKRYGVAKSTMSDWLSEWEANHLIAARSQSGRCKQIADA